MSTLRQVTDVSRHILVIGLLSIVGIFILVTAINYIKGLHPTPPPPPTVAFGKIAAPNFPQSVTTAKLIYNLDTVSGNLPDFGDRATVFTVQQINPTLNALEHARTLVESMGYNSDPTKISDTKYQWTNADDIPKTLLLNIYTNDFALSSNYSSNRDVTAGNNLPDENGAIATVVSFLQNASLMPSDIDTNKTKATLLSISSGQLVPTTSLSSTQVIQVDLFQQDVNGLPIFYPLPTHSTMNLYVAGGNNFPQIVLANFNHQTVTSTKATYPIITPQQALDMLKMGQGYIASFDGSGTTISIRNIVLGYYMSDKPQPFLEPIIVFEGDHGFYAYVPAISSSWISK